MDIIDLTIRARRAAIWFGIATVLSIALAFYFGHDPEIPSGSAYVLGVLVGVVLGVFSVVYGLAKSALDRAKTNR